MTENTSHYDPSRKTVGAIYRDLQMTHDGYRIEAGNMTEEISKSFVDDLNDAIGANPYEDQPYYILIHEKKDLQMKSAILRRVIFFKFRPWPEDDTVVFHHDPAKQETRFCWCLPHHSEMDNMLSNQDLYNKEMIKQIYHWKQFNLIPFGFMQERGNWIPNPRWQDMPLERYARKAIA